MEKPIHSGDAYTHLETIICRFEKWLKENCAIGEIVLGVNKLNRAAVRACEKIGFKSSESNFVQIIDAGVQTMVWNASRVFIPNSLNSK